MPLVASDRNFKTFHREAKECESSGYDITHTVCGRTAKCVHYSVSAKPVSMHLPLTRLFAALCLHLGKHDLSLAESHVFDVAERPTMVELLEPVLRTTVLVSQVSIAL